MANQRAASGTNFMRNFVTYKQGISTGNITESILGDIYWIGKFTQRLMLSAMDAWIFCLSKSK